MYSTEQELIDSGRFAGKTESWLETRKWIHENPMSALDVLSGLAKDNPKFLDLIYDFNLWCRPEQFMDWQSYDKMMYLCGRGFGKSKLASSYIVQEALSKKQRIALWASDLKSAKRNNWLGSSGIIESIHPDILKQCNFNKTDLTLTFPNKSTIVTYTAEAYERSRGDSVHLCVLDELAAWSYVDEALEAAQLILRLGVQPRLLITTTPRSLSAVKKLASADDVKTVKGLTSNNYYLPKSYEENLRKSLTERMYRQECLAEILDDNLYAMFQLRDIIDTRIPKDDFQFKKLTRIVIGVDPAVSSNENSDLTGIVIVGKDIEGKYYVLEDSTMQMATPEKWASKVITLYQKYNAYPADVSIVAEKNQGGEMVSTVIKNAARTKLDGFLPPVKLVTATKGKEVRAEPIAALYERHEVHHVGEHPELEFEMTEWNPTDKNAKSPDRLDALVWALTRLSKSGGGRVSMGYGGYGGEPTSGSSYGNDENANPYCGYR